jgi:copper chaperone CopZ
MSGYQSGMLGAAATRMVGGAAVGAAKAGVRVAGWTAGRAAGGAGTAVGTTLRVGGGAARDATGAAQGAAGAAVIVPRGLIGVGRALVDLHPRRHSRRVWAGHGHAHIEVRGLERGARGQERMARAVTASLRRLRGVRWAEVNAVTGQVLLAFDERQVSLERLVASVAAAEEKQGLREEAFSWAKPVHPGDGMPVHAVRTELLADCVSVGVAFAERLFHLPSLPSAVRVGVAALEVEKGIRRQVVRRIGPFETELAVSLAEAAVNGLCAGIGMPAIDAVYRALLLGEIRARRRAWEERETELCPGPGCVPDRMPGRHLRPRGRPLGPVERWDERLEALVPCLAGAVLALTRSPGRAADSVLASVPRAARYGRDGFAGTVGRDLARRGVLPLDPAALRALDTVTAIVVDSEVLVADRPHVLEAHPAEGAEMADLWRAADRVLRGLRMGDFDKPGPWRGDGYVLDRDERRTRPGVVELMLRADGSERCVEGRVTVGGELDPLAEAVLDAARSSGARVVVTDGPSAAELLPLADEVFSPGGLADGVRGLQGEGASVLVVARDDAEALMAADVALAVPVRPGEEAAWSADLVCFNGLDDVWRVLRAVGPARTVSERSVRLAGAGLALGALLALVGRRRGWTHALTPAHAAALVSLLWGTAAGLRLVRAGQPPRTEHVAWHALDAGGGAAAAARP